MPAPTGTLVVLAKAPVAGLAKTRLAPRYGPRGAALLAAAALQDTLDAVAAAAARHRVLVLDGDLAQAVERVVVPPGFDVVPQVPGTHAERIAAALAGCSGATLLVGMDTPQLTPALLRVPGRTGACLGPAADGGWWALGLRDPARHAAAALVGVAMSTPDTGAAQHRRLRDLGLRVTRLPLLRDVDEPDDADAVAALAPATRFAAAHRQLLAAGAGRGVGAGR